MMSKMRRSWVFAVIAACVFESNTWAQEHQLSSASIDPRDPRLTQDDYVYLAHLNLELVSGLLNAQTTLRTLLLKSIALARLSRFVEARASLREAQEFLDHSARAVELRKQLFYQAEIDLTAWDVGRLEGSR